MYFVFSLILATVLMSAAREVIKIYSEKASSKLTKELIEWSDWESGRPKPLCLGEMLYRNIHAQGFEAASYTPAEYKNGWRTQLADNPKLAYVALKLFGPDIIKRYNAGLKKQADSLRKNGYEKYKNLGDINKDLIIKNFRDMQAFNIYPKNWTTDSAISEASKRLAELKIDSVNFKNNLAKFSVKNYWLDQRRVISQYKKLINKLLSLDDKRLYAIIHPILSEQSGRSPMASSTQKWLLDNQLIQKLPKSSYCPYPKEGEQAWYLGQYPVDLLLLTARVYQDYPDWTYRAFLTEANQFTTELEKIIPQ